MYAQGVARLTADQASKSHPRKARENIRRLGKKINELIAACKREDSYSNIRDLVPIKRDN
jgi:hypothetical protein